MKATLTALTVTATMFANSASAFDPAHLQQLKNTGKCATCDLGGADLSGTDLGGTNLSGAKLISANLKYADLEGTNLSGVRLCNTTVPYGSVINSGC